MNRAANGSGNYRYSITAVLPTPAFTNGSSYTAPDYGFEINPDTMQVKVPAYIDAGKYAVRITVTDDFTTQSKDFYLNLTVKNPTVVIESDEYEFSLDFMRNGADG